MKKINRQIRDEILKQPYVTANDVYSVLPIGKNQARTIFNQIESELKEKGIPLFNTLPRVIPTKYLIQKYGR